MRLLRTLYKVLCHSPRIWPTSVVHSNPVAVHSWHSLVPGWLTVWRPGPESALQWRSHRYGPCRIVCMRHICFITCFRARSSVDSWPRRVSSLEICKWQPNTRWKPVNKIIWRLISHLIVTSDESGDGDGTFYLQGGKLMPEDVLDDCEEFSEKVIVIKGKFEGTFSKNH